MTKKFVLFLLAAVILIGAAGVFSWYQFASQKTLAEKTKYYRVGLLQMTPTVAENMEGFKLGLAELGYQEGENIEYFYRDANGDLEALKKYAAEVIAWKPDMIFVNTSPATLAVKKAAAASGIPVVFSMVADPLGAGIVSPTLADNKNITGTGCAYIDIAAKRLQLLKEIDPRVKKVLIFYRPEDKSGAPAAEKIINAGSQIGVEIVPVTISKKEDIQSYLTNLSAGEVDAIMDPADSMATAGLTEWGMAKARELKIPLMMLSKGECASGALASFGVDYIDLGKQTALIANQVLNGISPADIPFEQPRKWFFALNLKIAADIGLTIPETILEKADLVIKD